MKVFSKILVVATSSVFFTLPATADDHGHIDGHDHTHGHSHAHGEHQAFGDVKLLVAVVRPTENNSATGQVEFAELGGGKVKITAKFIGLKPNAKHAIHIHEYGDIRDLKGKATGGHYNPENHDHALPSSAKRHAGDLGNLQADANGAATMELVVSNVSLVGKINPIVGRSIIVHEGEDDGGQPTGNAGPRISQGVIGIAKNK